MFSSDSAASSSSSSSSVSSSSSSSVVTQTFGEYVRQRKDKAHEGGRHASQNHFYSNLLLETLLAERNLQAVVFTDSDKKKLEAILSDSTQAIRAEFGYEWDNAKKQVKATPEYIAFIKALDDAAIFKNFVRLYRSKNNELACKFPSYEARERFISALGGRQEFMAKAGNKSTLFPLTYSDNTDTLYIPGFTSADGNLAAFFPSIAIRDRFNKLLGLTSAKVASIADKQQVLYIGDSLVNTEGQNRSVDLPTCCTPVGYATFLRQTNVHSLFSQATLQMPSDVIDIINSYVDADNGHDAQVKPN